MDVEGQRQPSEETEWAALARDAIDKKAKPPGSLGKLEDWAIRLCGLQKTLKPSIDNAVLLVFGADHGITKDMAVSAYPREVTPSVFKAIAAGKAACSAMASALQCQVALWDVGVDADLAHVTASHPNVQVLHYKIREGTASFLEGAAMEEEEVQQALAVGMVAVLAACGDTGCAVSLPIPPSPSATAPLPPSPPGKGEAAEGSKHEQPCSGAPSARALQGFDKRVRDARGASVPGGTWLSPPRTRPPSTSRGAMNGAVQYISDLCASDEDSPSCDERAVDDRSPPSVSQRCVHCGMPTRPSRYPTGDPDVEVPLDGTSSPGAAIPAGASLPLKGAISFVSGCTAEPPAAAVPRGPDESWSQEAAASGECCSSAARGSTPCDLPQIVQDVGRGARGRQGTGACRGTVVCIGEIGIGNTTAASAILAALESLPPEATCGIGTGLDEEGVRRKAQAVREGLAVNAKLLLTGPKGILRAVGGLEIAAMAGAYLACGHLGIPALVDGFISGVAALVAQRLDPRIKPALFWSHSSAEKASTHLLAAAGSSALPVLDMGLRLGEGTGALLALPVLRAAASVMSDMASLEECLQL